MESNFAQAEWDLYGQSKLFLLNFNIAAYSGLKSDLGQPPGACWYDT